MLTFLNHGAFAHVFDAGDGTVVKVFRRVQQTHAAVQNWDDHEFIIRQLCATEVRAYEWLQSRAKLADYTPRYFGKVDPVGLGLESRNPMEPYVSDCALRLELIGGKDIKIAHVDRPLQQEIETVLEEIRDGVQGINVWDCSCFIPGPRTPFTVIDFALWDNWVDVQLYLEENGSLPGEVRDHVRVL